MELDRNQLLALSRKILDGIMDESNQESFTSRDGHHYMYNWDWFQGVALFGIYRYWRETGEQAAFDYLVKWFDEHIERGLPGKNVNSMSPCLTLSFLWEHTGNEKYLEICREWAEYAMYKLPRTVEGGIQHVTIDSDNYQQLWDDTLYMTVLFLSRMGRLLKKDEYVQESAKQFLVHVKYLTDRKSVV